jgi:hypothetical protein
MIAGRERTFISAEGENFNLSGQGGAFESSFEGGDLQLRLDPNSSRTRLGTHPMDCHTNPSSSSSAVSLL